MTDIKPCSLCHKEPVYRLNYCDADTRISCCGFTVEPHTMYGTATELETDESLIERWNMLQVLFKIPRDDENEMDEPTV